MEVTMWKRAVLVATVGLAALPAFAADASSQATAATAHLAPATLALDKVGIQKLTERVVALEKRMDQIGVPEPAPAPTQAELERAKLMEEQHEEFLNQVWNMP